MTNALTLHNPDEVIATTVSWIARVFASQQKKRAVIAISGGIDSALALTLLSKALSPECVFPLLLPFGEQSIGDSQLICQFNNIPSSNVRVIDIQPIVESAWKVVDQPNYLTDFRRGNLMARSRMMMVFDRAKALDALVCGTENKSEHWLGYWTRFGDAASDLEPIAHLYKTQVRQLATSVSLPDIFLTKSPSAGLWIGQTDEQEMGFSYADADQVLYQALDVFYTQYQRWPRMEELHADMKIDGVSAVVSTKVIQQMQNMYFKLEVPYVMKEVQDDR